jgi:hypothetical protein
MRTFLLCLLGVASAGLLLVSAAPINTQATLCPSLPVQLELRSSPTLKNKYQLVFASIDPNNHQNADFVDIHYRINNMDSVNLRVSTQDAVTEQRVSAKQAQVDGISLVPGDALRAYATYQAKGYACDTPVHTFSAPESDNINDSELDFNNLNNNMNNINSIRNMRSINNNNNNNNINRNINNNRNRNNNNFRSNNLNNNNNNLNNNDFWSQAALEEVSEQGASCPAIAIDQDIVKIQGLDNTYMLTFENTNPAKQLHYVDLHLSTDAANGWDNLRLASDMQLHMAHKVMQPGVVIKPTEQLKWYWSYRATASNGEVVDCTTPVSTIAPNQITHEITMQQLNAAARS